MMLLESLERRTARQNLWLGGTTGLVAGLTNVCAVIAFFAFASNVTGHWALFAEEIVKGHWHQVSVLGAWLIMFVLGAFVSNHMVTALRPYHPYIGRAAPCVLEIVLLGAVGYYGHHHYGETLRETEYLMGVLLFAMGCQNGMVSSITNNVVRTTHLTGLSTDLGMELSLATQARYRRDPGLWFKLKLRFAILGGYVVGGIGGGLAYLSIGFQAFYVGVAILVFILTHDLVILWQSRDAEAPAGVHRTVSSTRRVGNGGARAAGAASVSEAADDDAKAPVEEPGQQERRSSVGASQR